MLSHVIMETIDSLDDRFWHIAYGRQPNVNYERIQTSTPLSMSCARHCVKARLSGVVSIPPRPHMTHAIRQAGHTAHHFGMIVSPVNTHACGRSRKYPSVVSHGRLAPPRLHGSGGRPPVFQSVSISVRCFRSGRKLSSWPTSGASR